jgi:hypothetical protein
MKKFLATALTFLFTLSAFGADFSGHWEGDGSITAFESSRFLQGKCAVVSLDVTVSASTIDLKAFEFQCDHYWSSYGPGEAVIVGKDIMYEGFKIGEIDSNHVAIEFALNGKYSEKLLASVELGTGLLHIEHASFEDTGSWTREIHHDVRLRKK